MTDIKFLNYNKSADEKYYTGVVTVRVWGKIDLAYRIIKNKEGNHFPASASTKVLGEPEEKYIEAFSIDSRSENAQVLEFVMACFKNETQGRINGKQVDSFEKEHSSSRHESALEDIPF